MAVSLVVTLAVMFASAMSFTASAGPHPIITEKQLDGALNRLDRELAKRNRYKAMRQKRIDEMKQQRTDAEPGDSLWFALTRQIADAYNTFNIDSALVYYSAGLRQADADGHRELANIFKANHATYMALAGFIADAISEFESIDTADLDQSPASLQQYYNAGRQMYSYISAYYKSSVEAWDYWNNKTHEMQRLLLRNIEPTSPYYRFYEGEYFYNNHEPLRARTVLLNILHSLNEDQHVYAIVCNLLAKIASEQGDVNECKYYLALSAISDVRTATLEVVSLQELGSILSEEKQTERSHSYLSAALNNAVESRASIRMLQTSELLTLVEQEHLKEVSHWRLMTNIVVVILLVLVASLFFVSLSLHKKIRSLSSMQQNLRKANDTKDMYLSQFLSLCSIYMDKLREMSKVATRKLSAGQADDLLRIVKSSKFVDEQSREFFAAFDDAFLHIYPNFVEEVNKLLRPEERIELKEGEQLNTALRILAFMRLGIEDANTLARVLNYSVNTIYAYRTRLRNKAINHTSFETDVMRITSI